MRETERFLTTVAEHDGPSVEALIPDLLPARTVREILRSLLKEGVSIKDGATIVDALCTSAPYTKDLTLLIAAVRKALKFSLINPYLRAGELPAFVLAPSLEREIEESARQSPDPYDIRPDPEFERKLIASVSHAVGGRQSTSAVVASPRARFGLKGMIRRELPNVA